MKEQLINSIELTKNNASIFFKRCKDDLTIESNYSDWNGKDVLSHISQWVHFACIKLDAIKEKKPFEDISDFHEFNRKCYEKNKNLPLDHINELLIAGFDRLEYIVKKYDENEMNVTTFPTGFDMPLWKYILMDGFIHPNLHMLYHYLKKNNIAHFIKLVKNSYDYFMLYSGNDDGVFKFDYDYFESSVKCNDYFNAIKVDGLDHEGEELLNRIKTANIFQIEH